MILLIGYSTIPAAPTAFSRGITARTTDYSMMVFTSNQPSSDNDEIVGV